MSAADRSFQGLSSDELLEAVRDVLREVLPTGLMESSPAAPRAVQAADLAGEVVVQNDADLSALVRRVALLCDQPANRAALREGRHGFRLAGTAQSPLPLRAAPAPVVRIERGPATERAVAKAASDGARLVLGPKAVLTPLARDKARVLGVEIEKEH